MKTMLRLFARCFLFPLSSRIRAHLLLAAQGDSESNSYLRSGVRDNDRIRRVLCIELGQATATQESIIHANLFEDLLDNLTKQLQSTLARGAYQGGEFGRLETETDEIIVQLNQLANSPLVNTMSNQQKLALVQLNTELKNGRSTYSEIVHSQYSAYCSPDPCYDGETTAWDTSVRYPAELDF